MSVFVDLDVPAPELRQTLYAGHLVLLTQLSSVGRLVDFTREQLEKLFRPHDPEAAHEHFDKVEMARLLGVWKPSYIHSETAQALVCDIIREAGLPAAGTHYDLPKPRTSFPTGHLTTGIAYAFPWHRDTWYSAPRQQLNWWLPIYPVREDNAMTFDLGSFDQAVDNTSEHFDYYRNNVARLQTASQVTREEQARPAAPGHTARQELVVLPAPGAVLLFAGTHLHASIPNASGRARFSVDFRTVDVADVEAGRGAPTVDVHCTGTAIRDFLNVANGAPFAEETVVRLFGAPPADAMLVFGAKK
jgi:Phytanoyl-CoA dioxygenase (PhyH)